VEPPLDVQVLRGDGTQGSECWLILCSEGLFISYVPDGCRYFFSTTETAVASDVGHGRTWRAARLDEEVERNRTPRELDWRCTWG
jgi:hypothetical protein